MHIKSRAYFLSVLFCFVGKLNGQNTQTSKTFEVLYPILKTSLLKVVCEPYIIEEERYTLKAFSKETDMFLSFWKWDLQNKPLLINDIDNDGLIDYTIELINEGGGCGGQIGQEERWTLFGSDPKEFIWTHLVPYRSTSGEWQIIEK